MYFMTPCCFTSLRVSSDPPLWGLLEVRSRGNKKIRDTTLFYLWPQTVDNIYKDIREADSLGVIEQQHKTKLTFPPFFYVICYFITY